MKKIIALSLLTPFMTFAVATNASTVITTIGTLINQIAPILFALAFVWFIWTIVKYIEAGTGDPKKQAEIRDSLIYMVIMLFVLVSVWGIVGMLQTTTGIGQESAQTVKVPALTP